MSAPPKVSAPSGQSGALQTAKDFVSQNWKPLAVAGAVVIAVGAGVYVVTRSSKQPKRPPGMSPAGAAAERRRAAAAKAKKAEEKVKERAKDVVEVAVPTAAPSPAEGVPAASAPAKSVPAEGVPELTPENVAEAPMPAYPAEFFPEDIESLSKEKRAELAKSVKALGNKFYTEKKFTEAIELYTQAIKLQPDAVYYSNRAACYANLNDYEKVIEDCTEALKKDKFWGRALNRRAQAYEHVERYTDALNDYTAFCVLEEFKNEAAIAATDRVLKIIGKSKAADIIKQRKSRLPSETFISAYMDSFKLTSRDAPQVVETPAVEEGDKFVQKAFAALIARDWVGAYAHAESAIETGKLSSPFNSLAYNLRGTFRFLKGDVDDALGDFDKSLEFDPQRVNTIIKRASIFMEKLDPVQAAAEFDRAEAIDSADPDLYYHRGMILYQAALGQLRFLSQDNQGALEDYKRSLKLDENFVYAHIQHGVANYKLGDVTAAVSIFKKAARKFKNSGEVYNYHGEILLDTQQFQDALENFDKAIKLMPKSPLPYINKAILYLQWKQDPRIAEMECRKAIEVDPQCDIAFAQLAQLLLHQNKVEESLPYYDKAAELARTEMELMNAISCREAANAQLYVSKHYPEQMAKLGR
ncbi:TOM (translocase of outer membrane) complex component [Borealophlyctis nickersoniae]|nr:TOM (translocase of outer membrane) complex component [Borealophlyctis nickersoniae]